MKSLSLWPYLCVASAFAVASISTGCGRARDTVTDRSAAEDRAKEREAPSQSADAADPSEPEPPHSGLAVDLPKVSSATDGSPPYTFIIRATPERVTASNAPAIEALRASGERRVKKLLRVRQEAGHRIAIEGEADPRRATHHLIGDLFEVLVGAVENEKEWAEQLGREPLLTAALALDASLSMGTVVDLLYTTGKGEIADYVVQAEGPSGIVNLPLSPIRMECPTAPPECLSPAVFIAKEGVFVGVIDGPTPYTCDSKGKKPRAALLRSAAGGCPSVAPGAEMAGVDALIDALGASAPLCTSVYLGGQPDVGWGDVVILLASLTRRGPVQLSAEPLTDLSCAESLPVDEVLSALRGPSEQPAP